jgi:hypothetical protein
MCMRRPKKLALPALLTMTVLATLFFLFAGFTSASPAPGGRNPIPGSQIAALKGKTPLGATDGQQTLHLIISLNLSDPAGLKALIAAQNDRHSPLYHQYLTPQQFTERFAPSQASVDAVVAFLRGQGLTVQSVAANRLSIDAVGTVAAVEQAFQVQISNYSLNGKTVYAPSTTPSVPASLAGKILNIGGLDNVSTPHRLGSLAPQAPALGPGGGYTPSELRTAYDMNSLISHADGTGQTVGIIELDGYIPSDINTYLSFYNLGSAKYTNVLLDGADGNPTSAGGAIEVELDMEVVSAIAPGANQTIYIAPNTFQGFLDAFNQYVIDDTAKVSSDSWGLCEAFTGTSAMQAFDNVFAQGAAQGQAFFSASGDSGSDDCGNGALGVDFPASDPNVVGVGGTTLNTGSGGTYSSETVWNNQIGSDGGGLSSFFSQPSYQTGPGVSNSFSNGMREVPDVSADADPNTGYSEYCTDLSGCFGLGWFEVGGTSAAAPLWAGITTDLNEYLPTQSRPTLGSASAALYWLFNTSHPFAAYHDIKTGNNDFDHTHNGDYPATAGYDMASGIGTPDVWNIARDFTAAAPTISPSVISLVTMPGVNPASQVVTITNTGYSDYHWALGTLPAWLSADVSSGTIAPNASQQVTLSFTIGSSPQTYTTTLAVNDANNILPALSLPVTVVAANVSKTWYFAEGYTGGSFQTWLTLANPGSTDANVTVDYLLNHGTPIQKPYLVKANSRFTILVNSEIGNNQEVSMVVTSDQPIIAERPMYFTYTNLPSPVPGGSDVVGATSLSQDFDFGYLDTTKGHDDTWLTILNPDPTNAMTVTIQYFPQAGGTPTQITHTVAANSRGTVFVNGDVPSGQYSALVHLSLPGLVERPLYLKDSATNFTGSADVIGVAQPQTDWFFAEGYVSSTFVERYIVSNPTTTVANVTVTFFQGSGAPVTTSFSLNPGAQHIVLVSQFVQGNNSAHVGSTNGVAILAERFISFKYTGPTGTTSSAAIPGASDVLGANAPGNLFYFAEGYTGGQFAEYLTIENPDPTNTAVVTVTFLPANGQAPLVRVYTIAPSTRFTLFTNGVLNNQSFSMVVESNVAIVAERPMYFVYTGTSGTLHDTGGSDVIGYQP